MPPIGFISRNISKGAQRITQRVENVFFPRAEKAAAEGTTDVIALSKREAEAQVSYLKKFYRGAKEKLKALFSREKMPETAPKRAKAPKHEYHTQPKKVSEPKIETRTTKAKKRVREFFEPKKIKSKTQRWLDEIAAGAKKTLSEYSLAKAAPAIKRFVKTLAEKAKKLKESAVNIINEQKLRKIELKKQLFINSTKSSYQARKQNAKELLAKITLALKEGSKDKAKMLAGYLDDCVAYMAIDAKYCGFVQKFNKFNTKIKNAVTDMIKNVSTEKAAETAV